MAIEVIELIELLGAGGLGIVGFAGAAVVAYALGVRQPFFLTVVALVGGVLGVSLQLLVLPEPLGRRRRCRRRPSQRRSRASKR